MLLAVKCKSTGLVYAWHARRRKSDMKERILETADRLFYLRGIRAMGVDTIAAEIGISKRTLYNHFPSKDALIIGLSGAPLRAGRALRTNPQSSKSSAPSIRWSGVFRRRISAAARSSTRSPSSAPRTGRCRSRDRLQGKPPALVSRSLDPTRCRRCRKALPRSWCSWSTARSRRIWCATTRRWRARQRRPRKCCWRNAGIEVASCFAALRERPPRRPPALAECLDLFA